MYSVRGKTDKHIHTFSTSEFTEKRKMREREKERTPLPYVQSRSQNSCQTRFEIRFEHQNNAFLILQVRRKGLEASKKASKSISNARIMRLLSYIRSEGFVSLKTCLQICCGTPEQVVLFLSGSEGFAASNILSNTVSNTQIV